MIWWPKKQLVGPTVALDMIDPRVVEVEVAKEILSALFDVGGNEVDDMIRHRIEYRELYGQDFNSS